MRYRIFIEDDECDGVGDLGTCETLSVCWAWLDQRFEDNGDVRMWWIKDKELEEVIAGMHCFDIWKANCETPQAFKGYIDLAFNWLWDNARDA